jgi:3',5'-cyclic AMP phosphodiesterase CpdA
MLSALASERCCRVVLIHHPPHPGGAPAGRNLTDAHRFERMIAEVGAELVLHGHNHVGSVAHLAGPSGRVPVVGAPSASERGELSTNRAGYFMFTIGEESERYIVKAERRGLDEAGAFVSEGMVLDEPTPRVKRPRGVGLR